MAKRRLISFKRKRMIAVRLTLAVVVLHAALLLTLAVTPGDPPQQGTLWQMLWASTRRPTFYVLLVVLIASPIFTMLATPIRGHHRAWLALSWSIFALVAGAYYAHRLNVMLQILWQQA